MKKFLKNKFGFTLSEVLTVVSILVLLLALVVPAIFSIRRSLRQTELDRKAEIIYTAVQDRLSELYAKGDSEAYNPSTNAYIKALSTWPGDYDNSKLGNNNQYIYYFLKGSDLESIITNDVLSEEVKDGYYVIEIIPYAAKESESDDDVITSGLVYGVYYSEDVNICESGTTDDYKHYVVNNSVSDSFLNILRFKEYRKSKDYGDAKVGYYGGSNVTSGAETSNLTITDIRINSNDEVNTAVVKVKAPLGLKNSIKFVFTFSDDYGHSYELTYKDGLWTTNNGKQALPDRLAKNNNIFVKNYGVNYTITFKLDDLSSGETRFDKLYGNNSGNTTTLVTGSNIQLKAYVECEGDLRVKTDTKTANGNSIFGYDEEKDNQDYFIIKNGRHLQNLDTSSGVENSIKTNNSSMAKVAKIVNDIDFSEDGTFYKEYSNGYFNKTSSYRKVNSTSTSNFVNFKSIVNSELTTLTSEDNKQYKLINFSTTGSGLFDSVDNNLTISYIDLTGERVFNKNDTNGGLIGTVSTNGNVTIDHVQSYLDVQNDIPSTITSDMNIEAYRWIEGSTVGGFVGANNGTLKITNSSVSTVLGSDGSITGGLVGNNAGVLDISGSYTDSYLYGKSVGGLVGKTTRSVNSIYSSYCAGFIGLDKDSNAVGAGLVAGNVTSAKNSYTIIAVYNVADDKGIAEENTINLIGKYHSTFETGSATNIYYSRSSVDGSDISNTSAVTPTSMNLGTLFKTSGKKITRYQLLGKSLSNYEYPILKEISHYGDWTAGFESGALVYYEEYDNGTYGFEGANLEVSLIKEDKIVGDGYGILFRASDNDNPDWVKVTIGNTTQTITKGKDYKSITVNGVEYYLYPLNKTIINPESAIVNFYQRVTIVDSNDGIKLYDFNPHFARTVVNIQDNDEVTPLPSNVGIRSPRHLYNLSKYYDSGYRSMSNVTYTQERNMIYTSYNWYEYTNYVTNTGEVITKQSPIGADEKTSFKDTYNGGGYEIGDVSFYTKSGQYVGMFGYSTGTIKNVVLATQYDASGATYNVKREDAVGANATVYLGILAGKNSGTITNSAVAGYYLSGSDGKINGYANSTIYIGGLVGYNDGTITDSAADGPKLSLTMHRATCYAGGFVGYNEGNITNSYALNHITSDVSGGKTMIAGFVAYNVGSINQSYCATALTSQGSGSYAYAFGSTEGGGTCRNSYYLYRGSYLFVDGLYSYDRSDSNSIGSYKTYQQFKDQRGGSVAESSYYHVLTTAYDSKETTYPYRAVVKDSNGNYVHYGEWQVKPNLGISGVFYWEHEEYGQNDGYKITYIGVENGEFKYQSNICTSHDDEGVITEYGYGYYVGDDYVDEIKVDTKDAIAYSGYKVNEDAQKALELQIPGITFYPYTTTTDTSKDYIYIKDASVNGTITITDSTQTYTYTISPFFANALSMTTDLSTTDNNAKRYINTMPGLSDNPYEIRSVAQLQYINWNNASKSTDELVDSNNYTTYTYLMNCGNHTTSNNTVTITNAGNNDRKNFIFKQSHDLNAESINNFVPIAGQGTSSTNGYNSTLYAWFGSTYDGQSYKIQELKINSTAFSVGLFGTTAGATIKNTILYSTKGATIERNTTSSDTEGAYSLGGLIGVAYDYATPTNNPVTNCAIAGYKIIDNSGNKQTLGEANVGGLIGVANVDVESCSSVVDIEINATHKKTSGTGITVADYGNYIRVGGLVGAVQDEVKNCYTGGSISVGTDTLDETYSDQRHILQDEETKANRQKSTNIFLSGIAGSAFTMNYQNFTGNSNIIDGEPKVTNCYTYITFPKMEGTIRNITMFASIADRFGRTTAKITNCYYLNTSANIDTTNLPKYYFGNGSSISVSMDDGYKEKMIRGSAAWIHKIYAESTEADNATLTNIGSKTYSELSDSKMINLLNGGLENGAFASVTSKDSYEQNIDGKYSFNAGTASLDGKNYPFPTVVTQDDNDSSNKINVHYGSWPFSGAYWEKGIYTLDIFENIKNIESDNFIYQTITLKKNGDTVNNLDVVVDESTPYVEIVKDSEDNPIIVQDDTDKCVLKVKVLKKGTARITATWKDAKNNEKSADFLLTVTANLYAKANPEEVKLANKGTTTVELTATNSKGDTINCAWEAIPSKKIEVEEGDVGIKSISGNKLTLIGYNLNAEVHAIANYIYNSETYTSQTVVNVLKESVIGFGKKDDTSSSYNEAKYTTETITVEGVDTAYNTNQEPSNEKSKYFIYEVNPDSFLEDESTTYYAEFSDKDGNALEDIYMEDIDKSDDNITRIENLDFKTIPVNFYFITSDLSETKTVNVKLTITNGNTTYVLKLKDVIANGRLAKLTYDANGGKFSDGSTAKTIDITEDIETNNLEQPLARTGYSFSGWASDKKGTQTVDTIVASGVTKDITLYAKWDPKKKNILFNYNYGNNPEEVEVEVVYDSETVDQKPDRNKYKFMGWYADKSCTDSERVIDENGKVVDKNKLNEMVLSEGTQTLYAKWTRKFKIQYVLDSDESGSTYTIAKSTDDMIDGDVISTYNPTEFQLASDGYSFGGWYYRDGDNAIQVTNNLGEIVDATISNVMITTATDGKCNVSDDAPETITLHAKWGKPTEVTGYFEVTSLTSGSSYIIVNSSNNKALALNKNRDNYSLSTSNITVTENGVNYISKNNMDSNAMWTYSNNTLTNNSYNRMLYVNSSKSLTTSSSSSSEWNYSDNLLSTDKTDYYWPYTTTTTTYYLTCNNDAFSVNTSSSNVHIYSAVKETKEIQIPTWIYVSSNGDDNSANDINSANYDEPLDDELSSNESLDADLHEDDTNEIEVVDDIEKASEE